MDQLAGLGSRNRTQRYADDAQCYCWLESQLLVLFFESIENKIMNKQIPIFPTKVLVAMALLFTFVSCNEDILDEKPLDFLSPDNASLTEQGALQGITAIHDRVRAAYYSFGEFGVMNWATHGSDLGYNGEIPAAGTLYLNSYNDMTPVWRNVVDTWNVGFEIIQWATLLI